VPRAKPMPVAISMMSKSLPGWRQYLFNSTWRYLLRILFALSGCAAIPWWLHQIEWTIPLTLGVVAAALADLDDRLTGRLKNLLITLLCFCIASVSVELLFPYPLAFMAGLAISTWGFILLGALGQRYATIAFGALLIAVYTMLGIGLFSQWYMQPMLLLVGALWYNLLTLLGHLMFPVRPVQEQLAGSFSQLARYLDAKANLFDPDAGEQDDATFIDAAMVNSQLVAQPDQDHATEPAARRSRFTRHPSQPALLLCGAGHPRTRQLLPPAISSAERRLALQRNPVPVSAPAKYAGPGMSPAGTFDPDAGKMGSRQPV